MRFLDVVTDPPDRTFKLRIVAPSPTTTPPQSTVMCPTNITNAPIDIEFNGQDARLGQPLPGGGTNVHVLLYTPNQVRTTNTFTMTGSIYACRYASDSATTITYADAGPPQTTTVVGQQYALAVLGKYEATR